MYWYFIFFFVSGFCSILYEVVWLRLAMAQFGVTTALVSIVLSAFMIGLGLGSWGSGYLIRRYEDRIGFPPLRLYAMTELLIGISALLVPFQLFSGRQLLQEMIGQIFSSSEGHYLSSGVWVAITLVPWCACMGATFPFAMLAIKKSFGPQSDRSFSYLYLANVLGAVAGATFPLLLIELLGFHRTLYVGAVLNFSLASCAFGLTMTHFRDSRIESSPRPQSQAKATSGADRRLLWLLFGTGLTSMGAEVIWIRLYTPSLSTVVYAFAAILAMYLAATYLGSWYYRHKSREQGFESGLLWAVLGASVLLPFLTVDPRLPLPALLRLVLGVVPFSAIVGFVTPMIVDLYSLGDPDLAGGAYAINIVGCVIGPLLSGFLLLPLVGERWALCLFALPWFIVALAFAALQSHRKQPSKLIAYSIIAASAVALAVFTESFEEQFKPREVLRDNTATVIATGSGRGKRLLINGVGITSLTPITKMMVHLPLALLPHRPANALIICFGMGTSHRSALSWHIQSTAVELVPSVPALFSYFHPDGPVGLDSPLSRVVIDDGRSYLERTQEKYDVIVIDPPPPIGAAASSLLYSKEFYAVARRHLRPGGILQQWFPGGDVAVTASVARALGESFPYVRAFGSLEGWGIHFLASATPIPLLSASRLAEKLPPDAAHDLMEWGPASSPQEQFGIVLSHELSPSALIQEDPNVPALQDDHPVNEYFILRRLHDAAFQRELWQRLLG